MWAICIAVQPVKSKVLMQHKAVLHAVASFKTRADGGFRRGFGKPFMTAGDAFPFVRKFQDVVHLAHRAGWFAHERKR
jgi:hypothetical protein